MKIQTGLSTSPIIVLSPIQAASDTQSPAAVDSCVCGWEEKDPPRSRVSLLTSSSLLGTHWSEAELRPHPGPIYNEACGLPSAEQVVWTGVL